MGYRFVAALVLLSPFAAGCPTTPGAIGCVNDNNCPPGCECADIDFTLGGECEVIGSGTECGGTCTQESGCPTGQVCRLEEETEGLNLYACLPPVGGIVLDQPRNDDWDYFSDASCDPAPGGCTTTNVVAENFLVPSTGASIAEIVIWGGWWPDGEQTNDDWTVIVHADAAGLPGAAVHTQANFAASSIQNIGQIFGVGYYEVTLELTGDVDLSPGTHWIEIFHDSGPGDDWFWVTGNQDDVNGLVGFAEAPEAPGVSWSAHDVDSEPPLRRSLAIRISG